MFDLAPVPVPDLSGKTVLITGAGRGIGAVLTRLLVGANATVYAGVLGAPEADSAAQLIGAKVLQLDITNPTEIAAAIRKINEDGHTLDALINNAGMISPIGHVDSIDSDALSKTLEVNVVGMHRMILAALPMLTASKGVIVNAGTGAATTPMEGWTAYCASKAAARMLTQMCAKELGPRGVQSFFIGIPPTDTAMQGEIRYAGLNPISQIPQQDLVDPIVPASVMAWLCGPDARKLDDCLLDTRDALFRELSGKS
jgi:NAD(P)-dependent dehydrogenase (short-subunit alcohol dehydrogenase family)